MSQVRRSDGYGCYEQTQNPRAKEYMGVSFFKREGSSDDENLPWSELPLYVPPTGCAIRTTPCAQAAAAAVAAAADRTPATISPSTQGATGNFPDSRRSEVKGRPGFDSCLPGATTAVQFLGKQRSSSDPGPTRDKQTSITSGDFRSPGSPIELQCIDPRPQQRSGSVSIGAGDMGPLGCPMNPVICGMAPLSHIRGGSVRSQAKLITREKPVGHRIGAYSLSPLSEYGVRERILPRSIEAKKDAPSNRVTKKRRTTIGRDGGSPHAISRVANGNSEVIRDLGTWIEPTNHATQESHSNPEIPNPPIPPALVTGWRVERSAPMSRKLLTENQPPDQGPEPTAISRNQKTDKPGQDATPAVGENTSPKAPRKRTWESAEPTPGGQGAEQRARKELAMKEATKVMKEEVAFAANGRDGTNTKPADPPNDSQEGGQGGGAGKHERLWRIPRENAPCPDKPTVPMHFNGIVIIEYLEQVAMVDLLEILRHEATHLPPCVVNNILEEAFLRVRELMDRNPLINVTKELCETIIGATLKRYPKPGLTVEDLEDRRHTRKD